MAPKGLPAARSDGDQRELLQALLDVYVRRVPDDLADEEAAKYAADRDLDELAFAWAGGTERANRTTTGCRAAGCSPSTTTPSAASTTSTPCGGISRPTSAATCWRSTTPAPTECADLVGPLRHFDRDERRRRLLVRHHLARPAASVEQVAADLVGLHSSDPATVFLSLRARLHPFAVADLEDALYERRSLLRMLAMRRTMFVVPLDLAAVMNVACTRALVAGERRKLVAMLADAALTDDVEGWIDRVEHRDPGGATGQRAAAGEPADEAGPRPRARSFASPSASATRAPSACRPGCSSCCRRRATSPGPGRSVRGCRASTGGRRWPTGSASSRPARGGGPGRSHAAVARRYGPGTIDDLAWWTKWTKANVRSALAAVGAVEVTADTGDDPAAPAWVLPDDLDDTPPSWRRRAAPSRCRCCPAWTRRSWAGRSGRGTSVGTVARCSTPPGMPARLCGSAAAPSACGARAPAAAW